MVSEAKVRRSLEYLTGAHLRGPLDKNAHYSSINAMIYALSMAYDRMDEDDDGATA